MGEAMPQICLEDKIMAEQGFQFCHIDHMPYQCHVFTITPKQLNLCAAFFAHIYTSTKNLGQIDYQDFF